MSLSHLPAPTDSSSASQEEPLTEAQERRVRDLAERVVSGREQHQAEVMMDGALRRLDLDLTTEQRQKVEEALLGYRKAERDVMDAARAEGLPFEDVRDKLRPLEERFQGELATFLPASDADALVRTLTAPQGPPPRGAPPPGQPSR